MEQVYCALWGHSARVPGTIMGLCASKRAWDIDGHVAWRGHLAATKPAGAQTPLSPAPGMFLGVPLQPPVSPTNLCSTFAALAMSMQLAEAVIDPRWT